MRPDGSRIRGPSAVYRVFVLAVLCAAVLVGWLAVAAGVVLVAYAIAWLVGFW